MASIGEAWSRWRRGEQQRFALVATHSPGSANVVAAGDPGGVIARADLNATHDLIKTNTEMVEVLRNQFAKGYASGLDLAAQEAQLAQVSATLPPLLKQLAAAACTCWRRSREGSSTSDFAERRSTQRV